MLSALPNFISNANKFFVSSIYRFHCILFNVALQVNVKYLNLLLRSDRRLFKAKIKLTAHNVCAKLSGGEKRCVMSPQTRSVVSNRRLQINFVLESHLIGQSVYAEGTRASDLQHHSQTKIHFPHYSVGNCSHLNDLK